MKELEITYEVNSGIPFRWEYEIKNGKIVEFVKESFINDNKDKTICGAPINHVYLFKGIKKGKTKIIFKYHNFADDYIDEEDIYDVVVDKDMNISIVNKTNNRI